MYLNKNLNFKKFIDPIETYLEEPLHLRLSTNEHFSTTFYLSYAKTELLDDYFQYWSKKSDKFYTITNYPTV